MHSFGDEATPGNYPTETSARSKFSWILNINDYSFESNFAQSNYLGILASP